VVQVRVGLAVGLGEEGGHLVLLEADAGVGADGGQGAELQPDVLGCRGVGGRLRLGAGDATGHGGGDARAGLPAHARARAGDGDRDGRARGGFLVGVRALDVVFGPAAVEAHVDQVDLGLVVLPVALAI